MKEKNAKIANFQFILSILIVIIHASTLTVNLPGKDNVSVLGANYSSFIQAFLSEGVCRSAVPIFFIVSGYLFYVTYDGSLKKYGQKLYRRIFSLVIPYVIWSSGVFLFYFIAQKIPTIRPYFSARALGHLTFGDVIGNILLDSFDSPLWFCRYLIVFSILSILLYRVFNNRIAAVVSILVTFSIWISGVALPFGIRTDAVFFYSAGIFIALHFEGLRKANAILKKYTAFVIAIWLIMLTVRTLLYCSEDYRLVAVGLLNRCMILLGCFALWYGCDYFTSINRSVWKVSDYSFILFVAHHPIVIALKKICLKLMGASVFTSLLACFISAAVTVLLILSIAYVAKKRAGRVYRIISGNRGK